MVFWHAPHPLLLPPCNTPPPPIALLPYPLTSWSNHNAKQRFSASCRVAPCMLPSYRQAFKLPGPPSPPLPYAHHMLGSFPRRSRIKANARGRDKGGNQEAEGGAGAGRVVQNLVLAGGLTYLTITGKLGWVFDAFVSLWVLIVLVPFVGVMALLWAAERQSIIDNCPYCGNEFLVVKFLVKDEPRLCPYCNEPFRINEEQFVKDVSDLSRRGAKDFKNAFLGFKQKSNFNSEARGLIVDVEAEVFDKDEVGR